jgi:hypothetical protein
MWVFAQTCPSFEPVHSAYMHVCTYVCMYVCMYVRTHISNLGNETGKRTLMALQFIRLGTYVNNMSPTQID